MNTRNYNKSKNPQPLNDALKEFSQSTGFDFLDLLKDKTTQKEYYEKDKKKDLTNYLENSKELFENIKPIRDRSLSKILV